MSKDKDDIAKQDDPAPLDAKKTEEASRKAKREAKDGKDDRAEDKAKPSGNTAFMT